MNEKVSFCTVIVFWSAGVVMWNIHHRVSAYWLFAGATILMILNIIDLIRVYKSKKR